MIKTKERKNAKVEVPFLDEISSLVMIKLLALDTYDTLTMKVNFEENWAFFEIPNDSSQVIVLDPQRVLSILDIRSLGYYKIQQGVLQQGLSKYYSFEFLHNLFERYLNFRISCKEKIWSPKIHISGEMPKKENNR